MSVYAVGQLVHTLPEGEPVWGVTTLAGQVYVLRWKERDEVEVYDTISYCLQRRLTVPNSRRYTDMTSCERNRCLYIADHIVECVHKLTAQGAATRWAVNAEPRGLATNSAHNLLVTCPFVRKIKEFSTYGNLLRELTLPVDVINPWHAVELTSGQFIVCHGGPSDTIHRVCKVSEDGRQVVQSHGEWRGSGTNQYDVPARLAVDSSEFVFVADVRNRRVTLLSPTLGYIRHLDLASHNVQGDPHRLYLDMLRRRLYVAYTEWNDERNLCTAGCVVVLSV